MWLYQSNFKSVRSLTSFAVNLMNGRRLWAALHRLSILSKIYGFSQGKPVSGQSSMFSAMVNRRGAAMTISLPVRTGLAGIGLSGLNVAGDSHRCGEIPCQSWLAMPWLLQMQLSMSAICAAPCLVSRKIRSLITKVGNLSGLELKSWIVQTFHFQPKMTFQPL